MTDTYIDELTFTFSPEEDSLRAALVFSVDDDGTVTIVEKWRGNDEAYGDYIFIKIPLEVWRQALPWIDEQLKNKKAPPSD